MPTPRFVVVSAPLEERVAASLVTRVQGAVEGALRIKHEVNDTLHRDDLGNKTADAISHVTRPGGLPFVLFMLLIAVLALRELALRIETKRILRVHKAHSEAGAQASTDHEHED